MNALADNPFTASLNTLGASIAPPKAILVVSAHWLTRGITQVQASPMPETIHDFGGLPEYWGFLLFLEQVDKHAVSSDSRKLKKSQSLC